MKEEKKKFDKKKYDIDYKKTHIKQFKVDLNIDVYNELCELLQQKNITKVQFVKDAFENLKAK